MAGIAYDVEAWASAEDGVGDAGSRGSSPTPPAAAAPSVERPVPARVLLRLLRLAALTGDCRPPNLLYTLLVHSLYTAATVNLVVKVVSRGRQRLAAGQTIVEVAAHSGFMGVFYVLMWAPLACCLVAGRRRYGEVLRRADHVLHRLIAMPTYRKSREKYRRCRAAALHRASLHAAAAAAEPAGRATAQGVIRHRTHAGQRVTSTPSPSHGSAIAQRGVAAASVPRQARLRPSVPVIRRTEVG